MKGNLVLILVVLAGPLVAGEAEVAAAKAFIESLTEIREGVLGKEELRIRMIGIDCGSCTLEVTKGEHESKPCYVVTLSGVYTLGEMKSEMKATSKVSHSLALITHEETITENGKLTKKKTTRMTGSIYKHRVIDEEAKEEILRDLSYEIKPAPTLLLGSGGVLLYKLLPVKAAKYEFQEWEEAAGAVYPVHVGVVELAGGVVEFTSTSTDADRGKDGKIQTKDETELWRIKDGKILRGDIEKGLALATDPAPKRTPIKPEAMEKQDKEFHPVCLFFDGVTSQDAKKLDSAINVDRFVKLVFDGVKGFRELPEADQRKAEADLAQDMIKRMATPDPDKKKSDRDKLIGDAVLQLLMHEENFVVSEGKDA